MEHVDIGKVLGFVIIIVLLVVVLLLCLEHGGWIDFVFPVKNRLRSLQEWWSVLMGDKTTPVIFELPSLLTAAEYQGLHKANFDLASIKEVLEGEARRRGVKVSDNKNLGDKTLLDPTAPIVADAANYWWMEMEAERIDWDGKFSFRDLYQNRSNGIPLMDKRFHLHSIAGTVMGDYNKAIELHNADQKKKMAIAVAAGIAKQKENERIAKQKAIDEAAAKARRAKMLEEERQREIARQKAMPPRNEKSIPSDIFTPISGGGGGIFGGLGSGGIF